MSDIRPARPMDTIVRPSAKARPAMPVAMPVPAVAPAVSEPVYSEPARVAAKPSRAQRKQEKKAEKLSLKQARAGHSDGQFLDSVELPPAPVAMPAEDAQTLLAPAPRKRKKSPAIAIVLLILIPLIAAAVAYYLFFLRVVPS